MNPALDDDRTYLELVKDNRHRWSWILWNEANQPLALSSISYKTAHEAAVALKTVRKEICTAPVIFYTDRRENRTGRYTQKKIASLTR